MFTSYIKRRNISSYGNGSLFQLLGGFEQVVVADNTSTYYVLDQKAGLVITFDQNWIFNRTYIAPNITCRCLKYILGYFFITSNYYLYKTDSNFNVNSRNTKGGAGAGLAAYYYWGIYYDNASSLIYVVSHINNIIDVFNTSLAFQLSLSLAPYSPRSINQFNGNLYVGLSSSQVLVLKNNTISSTYNISLCTFISSICFDIIGNMAITCYYNNSITPYNYEGVYQNKSISINTSHYFYIVDSMQRMVLISDYSIGIYY